MDQEIRPRNEEDETDYAWIGERGSTRAPLSGVQDKPSLITKTTTRKRNWALMPLRVFGEIIDVMQWANERPDSPYTPGSWRQTPNWREVYTDALLRHIADFQSGRERDHQSNLRHLAHAGSCIAIMIARSQMEESEAAAART